MAKTAWGIEAGVNSLKAVKLSYDGKSEATIEDVAIVPLAPFKVAGADESAALLGALRQLVSDRGIKASESAYISLPGRHAFSRVVTLPPVRPEAMRETIANEARGQIPIKLEEAVWDYQVISSDGSETQVNLYAVKRDVVTSLLNNCRAAGLPVKGIQLAPLGVYNFVKFELDVAISRACVCMDIGTENSDLLVIDGEKTWLRVVPQSGNDVTKALLMKDKRLSQQAAETLKIDPQRTVDKLNKDKPDPVWKDVGTVFEAMKPALRDMVSEISRSVGFYKNQNEGAQLKTLVLMGNGSRLLNLPKFFEQQLEYKVYRVDQLSRIGAGRGLDPAEIQARAHSLVVPVGLALQAVGAKGLATTNLIPQEQLVQEQLSRLRPLAIVGGALIFIAGVASLATAMGFQSDVDKRTEDLIKAKVGVDAQTSAMARALAPDAELTRMIASLQNANAGTTLVGGAHDLLAYTLNELATDKPEAQIILSAYKKSDEKPGLDVREVKSELRVPVATGEQPAADPNAPPAPTALVRETEVVATANLAVVLTSDLSEEDANNLIANELQRRLIDKLATVLMPESERPKDAKDRENDKDLRAKFALIFTGRTVGVGAEVGKADDHLINSMLRLRLEVGPLPDSASTIEARRTILQPWVRLGGVLRKERLKITDVAPAPKSGRAPDIRQPAGKIYLPEPQSFSSRSVSTFGAARGDHLPHLPRITG